MKFAVIALLSAPLAAAHYTFAGLVVNGQGVGRDWQYIREHKRGYMPTKFGEILENDFRCNQGASSGANTQVMTVKAGDKVGLKQAFGGTGMAHPGPVQVYVSKAPGDVKSYDGSGDWVKVFQGNLCKAGSPEGLKSDSWCMWQEPTIEFIMPDTLPAGEYLVRAEHIALHGAHDKQAEFYYACAQVKLEGTTATSVPGTAVKIPGVYKVDDKPINFSVWGKSTSYPEIPGPEVIPGGQTRGSTTGAGGDVIVKVAGGASSAPKQSKPVAEAEDEEELTCTRGRRHIGSVAAKAKAVVA